MRHKCCTRRRRCGSFDIVEPLPSRMFLVTMLRHTRLVDALAVPTYTRCLVIVLRHAPDSNVFRYARRCSGCNTAASSTRSTMKSSAAQSTPMMRMVAWQQPLHHRQQQHLSHHLHTNFWNLSSTWSSNCRRNPSPMRASTSPRLRLGLGCLQSTRMQRRRRCGSFDIVGPRSPHVSRRHAATRTSCGCPQCPHSHAAWCL